MKVKTLQILWHGRDPVLSADFHPTGLVATAGADKEIKLWKTVVSANGAPYVQFLASLSHHANAVNIVRFSPSGDYLASGADGGEILLWRQTKTDAGSQWKVQRSLSRHEKDVLDLCWSPDGSFLASSSVDNSVLIWDVQRGVPETFLKDHGHYVQGVAWDPLGSFLASCSADRTCRVYSLPKPAPPTANEKAGTTPGSGGGGGGGNTGAGGGGKGGKGRPATVRCVNVIQRREVPAERIEGERMRGVEGEGAEVRKEQQEEGVAEGEEGQGEKRRAVTDLEGNRVAATVTPAEVAPKPVRLHLFADETLPSFFRRLSWAPDGSVLAVPAGIWRDTPSSPPEDVTYLFSRTDLAKPLMCLPSMGKPTFITRFCPVLFHLPTITATRNAMPAPDHPTHIHTAKIRPSPDPPCTPPKDAVAVTKPAGSPSPNDLASSGEGGGASSLPFRLPYRMVLAMATTHSVFLFDTVTPHPIAVMAGLHYAPITDIAWSADARQLLVTSQDGYCSVATFAPDELGVPFNLKDMAPAEQECLHFLHPLLRPSSASQQPPQDLSVKLAPCASMALRVPTTAPPSENYLRV